MNGMEYYSNELDDNFIEIDDTISSEEYYASKSKKEKKKKNDFPYDWAYSATVTSPMYYNSQWLPSQLNCANTQQCILDAQQYNGYQDLSGLANNCISQRIKTTPDEIIQSYYKINDDFTNTIKNLCKILVGE